MITYYENFWDDKPKLLEIDRVLERIKSPKEPEIVTRLRGLSEEEYKKEKKKLPCLLFNGEFSKRAKNGIIKGSGYFILDFDKLEHPEKRREEVEKKPFVYSVFTSVNGVDFKALIRVPIINNDYEYKVYFDALKKEFPEIDPTGKDISRICFFTYDPNIYINKGATLFTVERGDMKVKKWDSVNSALKLIESAVDGEKHLFRTKIAYLFGGWASKGEIEDNEALSLLLNSVAKNTTDYIAAKKTVEECFHAGKLKPLGIGDEKQILSMKTGLGKVYYSMDDVHDKVMNFIKEGYTKGNDLGWAITESYYSLKKGATTYLYGTPASGKTQFWHEVLVNQSAWYGWNHVIMSPESGDVEHIYAELISIAMKESIIGKPVDPEKYKHIAEFIRLKFFVIDPLGKRLTLRDVLNQVEILERMHNIKIDTITIDPLNYLDINTYGDRDDVAQGKDLDLFLADAKANSRHNCIITHVRDIKSREIKIGKDVIGHYKPMPTPFDVANGQMFYRKGFGMLATWRPLDTDRNPLTDDFGNEYPKNTLIIDVQKIKPKGTGELGRFSLYYDASKNCFYEAGKRYSWQYKEK